MQPGLLAATEEGVVMQQAAAKAATNNASGSALHAARVLRPRKEVRTIRSLMAHLQLGARLSSRSNV